MNPEASGKSMGRRDVRLWLWFGLIALVVGGWTVAWFVIRSAATERIELELTRLTTQGFKIECANRSIVGYPFRIEIHCANLAINEKTSGATVRFSRARAVGLIYQPSLVILEFDGPATALLPDGSQIATNWKLLHSSIRHKDGEIVQVSMAGDALDMTVSRPGLPVNRVKAGTMEVHLRPDLAERGLDAALSIRAGSMEIDGRPIGPDNLDLELDTTLARLPSNTQAPGFLASWAANDGRLDLKNVRASTANTAVQGRGAIGIEPDGLLNGVLKLTATGLEALAADPQATRRTPGLGVLASGFLLFGKPDAEGSKSGRTLDVSVERGRMKLGAMTIGTLPPIFGR